VVVVAAVPVMAVMSVRVAVVGGPLYGAGPSVLVAPVRPLGGGPFEFALLHALTVSRSSAVVMMVLVHGLRGGFHGDHARGRERLQTPAA
jgi:hypothetical protein